MTQRQMILNIYVGNIMLENFIGPVFENTYFSLFFRFQKT